VAASSSEVSASICSTTWRHQFADVSQQPSSTWVKKRGGKDSSRLFLLLLSNLLLCCDFVHVYAIKLAKWASKRCKKMWDWGDGSSQTCCQRNANSTTVIAMLVNATEAHACAPITNRNANRHIKNKEVQMVNPSARKFSRPSVFIAHTFLHQVTGPVLNHHTNDAVMVCPTGMIPASVILQKNIEIVFVHYLCPDWAYHLNTYDIMI